MNNINVGHIIVWLLLGGLLTGLLLWKFLKERKIRKEALSLKGNVDPLSIEILEIKRTSNGMVVGIVFEYTQASQKSKDTFVPRKFLTDFDSLSIERGEAKLYVRKFNKREPAFLEVGYFSSW